jgi:hypothetical protein
VLASKGGMMSTKEEDLGVVVSEGTPRFAWLPLIPWALVLAFGIAMLGFPKLFAAN